MIRLIFGNVGSGKTASIVRYMIKNNHKNFITNIDVYGEGVEHITKLMPEMIVKKELLRIKRTGEEVFKLTLNVDYWKNLLKEKGSMNVIIDEAHVFFNPRRSMTKLNIIMTDFLALLRRVLGNVDDSGELVLITQLSRRLDVVAKEMANDIAYHVLYYAVECQECKNRWQENNETANKNFFCQKCGSNNLKKIKSVIEVFKFSNIEKFEDFKYKGMKSYYLRYRINDIESIFGNYETLQFDDLMSTF